MTREMLEGEAYWGRIRHIKRILYIVEIALIIFTGLVLVIISGEFSTSPFMLPCDKLLWFVLIMMLIVMIEGFIFRTMQINMARSDSVKYIMATNSIRKAVVFAVVAAVIAAVFLVPGVAAGLQNSVSLKGTVTPGEIEYFQNRDPMGLSRVDTVSVHCPSASNVYIVTQFIYDQYPKDQLKNHPVNVNTYADLDLVIDLKPLGVKMKTLYIFVEPADGGNDTKADYTVNATLSTTLTGFLPVIAMIFVVLNSVWITYLYPMRRKCAKKSIYK